MQPKNELTDGHGHRSGHEPRDARDQRAVVGRKLQGAGANVVGIEALLEQRVGLALSFFCAESPSTGGTLALTIDAAVQMIRAAVPPYVTGTWITGGQALPGLMEPEEFDLAGFCVGVVERDRLIDGTAARARPEPSRRHLLVARARRLADRSFGRLGVPAREWACVIPILLLLAVAVGTRVAYTYLRPASADRPAVRRGGRDRRSPAGTTG